MAIVVNLVSPILLGVYSCQQNIAVSGVACALFYVSNDLHRPMHCNAAICLCRAYEER